LTGSSPWARKAATQRPTTPGSEPTLSFQEPFSFWVEARILQAFLVDEIHLGGNRIVLAAGMS
jgi:hypothetical protein